MWSYVPGPVLAILCAAATVSGQRLRWSLDRHSTAHYQRQATAHGVIVKPAPAPPEVVPGATEATGKNLLGNPSAERRRGNNANGWGRLQFAGTGKLGVDPRQAHAGKVSLVIESRKASGRDRGFDATWWRTVAVAENTRYRLSGWVRTQAVDGGSGARLAIIDFGEQTLSDAISGTTDWTRLQIEFSSGAHQQIRIGCCLGAFRQTRGKAWFDDLSMVELGRATTNSTQLVKQLFPGKRAPAVLRGKDLDSKRLYSKVAPLDPRDIPLYLALDLRRTDHEIKLRKLPFKLRRGFERIWMQTTFRAVGEDGKQRIIARFSAMQPRRVKMPKPKRTRSGKLIPPKNVPLRPETLVRISGELTIDRQLNREFQRVEGFTSKLVMRVELPKTGGPLANVAGHESSRVCQLTFDEACTWERNSRPNDSHLQARVHHAIHIGARSLRGRMGRRLPRQPGHLALAILTLLKAGDSAGDQLVQRALGKLRRARLNRTYDLAVAIMAIEAVYAPLGERDDLIKGRIVKPAVRRPTPADQTLLEEWVKALLGNVDRRPKNAYLKRWNYTPGARFDNSNTQYALLGLYTAMLCGVEVSPTVWFAAANHWIDVQCRAEKTPVALQLVSHRQLAEMQRSQGSTTNGPKRARRTVRSGVPTRARGWSYAGPGRKATGSMTTAGITGLVICDAALRQADKGTRELRSRMRDAIDAGFAWLARHFTVDSNPNDGDRWHYYYLYGLERACEIHGTVMFQDRRWYSEGAELLLSQQGAEGNWSNLVDTCFAILFLKKAAPPVISGR